MSIRQSTWLFPANQGPECTFTCPVLAPSHSADTIDADRQASSVLIAFVVIIIVFCCLNLAYLRYANQKKAERRAEAGGVIDASTWSAEGDRHPHFVYSY